MTLQDVTDTVKTLGQPDVSAERVHRGEDRLWINVLSYIADGGINPEGYAKEALKTLKIPTRRNYA